MLVTLTPHPNTPGPDIRIAVEIMRPRTPAVALRYSVVGDVSRVATPAVYGRAGADELWRTTCFEAFIEMDGGAYCEINLSPTGAWTVYDFAAYREGMRAHAGAESRDFRRTQGGASLDVAATFDLDRVVGDRPRPWRMGVSAVIEDVDGAISYWALTHPAGKPDFHHPDSFALILPAAEPA